MIYIDLYYCVRDLQKCRAPRCGGHPRRQCSGYMFEPRTVYKISNILLSTVNHYTAYTILTLIITTQECHYTIISRVHILHTVMHNSKQCRHVVKNHYQHC